MRKIIKKKPLVEHLIIIALVSVIALGSSKLLGGCLKDSMTRSSCGLLARHYVEGEAPGQATCQR